MTQLADPVEPCSCSRTVPSTPLSASLSVSPSHWPSAATSTTATVFQRHRMAVRRPPRSGVRGGRTAHAGVPRFGCIQDSASCSGPGDDRSRSPNLRCGPRRPCLGERVRRAAATDASARPSEDSNPHATRPHRQRVIERESSSGLRESPLTTEHRQWCRSCCGEAVGWPSGSGAAFSTRIGLRVMPTRRPACFIAASDRVGELARAATRLTQRHTPSGRTDRSH